MALTVTTYPTEEPLELQDVKDHIGGINDDEQDALLESLITAAREVVEKLLGRALVTTTYKYTLDSFPGDYSYGLRCGHTITLPKPPVQEVLYVKYRNSSGDMVEIDLDELEIDTLSEPARIAPVYGATWPTIQEGLNAVEISFTAGYSLEDNPTEDHVLFPQSLKKAMLLLIGHWYANPEAYSDNQKFEVPMAAQVLLSLNEYGRWP